MKISILNVSTLPDVEIAAVLPTMQTQIDRDFWGIWGMGAKLDFVVKGVKPTPGTAWMGIFDHSDQPGAAGYHDLTSEGLPFGKVFQATDKQYGMDWRTTLSHELLELILDPDIVRTAFIQTSSTGGTLYAFEAADPVQNDSYLINGVPVSNFITDAYFEPGRRHATSWDFLGKLKGPVPAVDAGGYLSYFQVGSGKGWRQKNGILVRTHKMTPHLGSRRHLRGVDRDAWRVSTVYE